MQERNSNVFTKYLNDQKAAGRSVTESSMGNSSIGNSSSRKRTTESTDESTIKPAVYIKKRRDADYISVMKDRCDDICKKILKLKHAISSVVTERDRCIRIIQSQYAQSRDLEARISDIRQIRQKTQELIIFEHLRYDTELGRLRDELRNLQEQRKGIQSQIQELQTHHIEQLQTIIEAFGF